MSWLSLKPTGGNEMDIKCRYEPENWIGVEVAEPWGPEVLIRCRNDALREEVVLLINDEDIETLIALIRNAQARIRQGEPVDDEGEA